MWGNMNLNLFNSYLEVIYKKKPVMLLGELMIFKFLYDEYFLASKVLKAKPKSAIFIYLSFKKIFAGLRSL